MEAKELMIGDWVLQDDNLEHKRPCRIKGFFDRHIIEVSGETTPLHESHINPIPLTAEILDNSGFKKGHDAVENKDTFMSNFCPLFLVKEKGEWWLSTYDSSPEILNLIRIKYVHELQHFLRLCGMEREISISRHTDGGAERRHPSLL